MNHIKTTDHGHPLVATIATKSQTVEEQRQFEVALDSLLAALVRRQLAAPATGEHTGGRKDARPCFVPEKIIQEKKESCKKE